VSHSINLSPARCGAFSLQAARRAKGGGASQTKRINECRQASRRGSDEAAPLARVDGLEPPL
jgi:hypothetical protein